MVETGFRKWIVTLTLVFSTLMELLDTTVVNVSLPHIMGNLGATFDDIGWVVTSYSVAIIIVLPISGWLGQRLGRKNYYMASVILFTLFSFFCGHAHSLSELVFFRFLQGIAGGGMAPTAQAILIETWPVEELGMAMAMFGMGAVLGPVIGPVLGGYITDTLSWPWVFYINIPLCGVALFFIETFIRPTPRHRGAPVDWRGLVFLALSVGSLQVVLERGEKEDWFQTPYIVVLALTALIMGIAFFWNELVVGHPVVNLRIFRHRSFAIGMITTLLYGIGMFGSVFVYPLMFQNLLGFSAEQTGLVTVPSGIVTIMMMPLVGNLMKKRVPAQYLATLGMLIFFIFCLMMNRTVLTDGMHDFFWPLVIRGLGLSMLFVPITTLAVQDLRGAEIGQGTGLNNMMRQMGGSVGIALITTFVDRRFLFHQTMLAPAMNPYNPVFNQRVSAMTRAFMVQGMDAIGARQSAYASLHGELLRQSMLMSYTDVFWIVGIFFVFLIPLVAFQKMKKV